MEDSKIKLIECPRDAMQGLKSFIPTTKKAAYLNALLKVGFDTLDCGSFVSHKAVPQMADTEKVLEKLEPGYTKLLVIVANLLGAEKAAALAPITYLGYPLSVSEIFQKRNSNKTIDESFEELETIQNLCMVYGKKLVVYLSMAFGNPYKEEYNVEKVLGMTKKLKEIGVETISLSDTIGIATPAHIKDLYGKCKKVFPLLEWGLHLHSTPALVHEKLKAAADVGCMRIDGALGGFGGCPFAQDNLVGNMPTENIIDYYKLDYLDKEALEEAVKIAALIF